jgi:hypothetical protein
MYQIPPEYYLRLHFPRSRFSRRLEDMLLLLAAKITNIGVAEKEKFDSLLDQIIRETNTENLEEKTIRNQRTEMIRLFGLAKYADGYAYPGKRLTTLSQTQDIPMFFKSFCKRFQFPGGFVKPDRVAEMIKGGVKFKPAKYILTLLKSGESRFGKFAIDAAEATHFIFNDKRVTVNNSNTSDVLDRILEARKSHIELDKTGDVIRYARDFLNYMVDANLLNELKGIYVLNNAEGKAIHSIISDGEFFNGYASVVSKEGEWDTEEYKKADAKWMEWFADAPGDEMLETPTLALVKEDTRLPDEWNKIRQLLEKRSPSFRSAALKELGDEGEQIAYEHEKTSVGKLRPDLAHLVKIVSNDSSLGYDVLSLHAENGRRKKYIEVKTTKKNYESDVVIPFVISINEWSVAEQLGNDYYIYRVTITKEGVSIFAIRNPVSENKKGNLIIEPTAYKVIYSSESGSQLVLTER